MPKLVEAIFGQINTILMDFDIGAEVTWSIIYFYQVTCLFYNVVNAEQTVGNINKDEKMGTHNNFFPLADISDEAGEAEKSKEGKQLCQPQDPSNAA